MTSLKCALMQLYLVIMHCALKENLYGPMNSMCQTSNDWWDVLDRSV